jgi:hypothetical protein
LIKRRSNTDETDKTPRRIARRLERISQAPRRSAAMAGIAMQPYFAAVAQLQTFQSIRRLIGCFKLSPKICTERQPRVI